MLTPDMSLTDWGILALVSGALLALATMTLAAKPIHYVVAVLVPVAPALLLWNDIRGSDWDERQLRQIYSTICLTLVVMRLLYAPWFTRQLRRRRRGEPMPDPTTLQVTVAMFVTVAVFAGVATLIH